MPAPTPGYVKNVICRSLREIIDPSPKKKDVQRIWEFFDSKCVYCGKPLRKAQKEGHIDHLLPTSFDGPNHISNRVLSCASCNEAEKLDGAWQEFILRKNRDPDAARRCIAKIHEWQELNVQPLFDKNKLREIERLSQSASAHYDRTVREARRLRDT